MPGQARHEVSILGFNVPNQVLIWNIEPLSFFCHAGLDPASPHYKTLNKICPNPKP
jgi:hypothetical protein